jgi:transposase
MVYRELSVIEIREVLRAWLAGQSERAVAAQAGVDRKTSKRYVTAAVAAGLSRQGGEKQLTDELIGQVVSVVRPVRPDGHGQGWAELEARREQIAGWVEGGVPVVKIGILLARQGVVVAERTLHRFSAERCGAGSKVTTRVDDGPPGSELQIDFGDLGLIPAGDGKRRKLRALVFTAAFSRYMFVYLTFSMTLEEVIAGCEEAWQFFGGVFRVVVPDNMSPVVAKADAVNPRLTREWLEYSQARGFATDPARVRHPRDKPRVEAGVHYVQGNFFAGESFLDLADARSRMAAWLAGTANARVHGTTRQVPAVVFAGQEAPCLLPVPGERYQVPYWAEVKVHVDYHVFSELGHSALIVA